MGTDTRSLTPKRVTGASPPYSPTRLGHATTCSPRAPHRRPTAAGRTVTGASGAPGWHGEAIHPALRERPEGSSVLGSPARRPCVGGACHRTPSVALLLTESQITYRGVREPTLCIYLCGSHTSTGRHSASQTRSMPSAAISWGEPPSVGDRHRCTTSRAAGASSSAGSRTVQSVRVAASCAPTIHLTWPSSAKTTFFSARSGRGVPGWYSCP